MCVLKLANWARAAMAGASLLASAGGCAAAEVATHATSALDLKFSFGPQAVAGYTPVKPDEAYTTERGYGFDLGSKVAVVERGGAEASKAGDVTGQGGQPFFFSVKLAPGAYAVTVRLGDATAAANTTVKTESRRLMLEGVKTAPGEWVTRTFLVHVRVPQLPGGGMVKLKPRERDENQVFVQWDAQTRVSILELDWDEKLTLEFSGSAVALDTVEIAPAEKPVTVYLIGDSTVTDQAMEPWGAWGQMLPRWFAPPVLIANYAESGETTASFIGEKRWPKVLSEIHAGDYVFMQFGINDRNGKMPLEKFKNYFVQFITDTRKHGATPVLVTSQNLGKLDEQGRAAETLGDYPAAMREVAKEQNVALIDLNTMSGKFYEALGPLKLPKAFVDGTHQNDYGSYELAKCVVDGIVENKLPLAQYLVEDWQPFDPAKPDVMENFALPQDPQLDPKRPGAAGAPSAATQPAANVPAAPASGTGTAK